MIADEYTLAYGNPVPEEEASLKADDAVAVMMAGLIQSTGDYFRFEPDLE